MWPSYWSNWVCQRLQQYPKNDKKYHLIFFTQRNFYSYHGDIFDKEIDKKVVLKGILKSSSMEKLEVRSHCMYIFDRFKFLHDFFLCCGHCDHFWISIKNLWNFLASNLKLFCKTGLQATIFILEVHFIFIEDVYYMSGRISTYWLYLYSKIPTDLIAVNKVYKDCLDRQRCGRGRYESNSLRKGRFYQSSFQIN